MLLDSLTNVDAPVWTSRVTRASAGDERTNPNVASAVGGHVRNPWRELRKGWEEIVGRLREILALEDDWDGEGTPKPDRATVLFAIVFVKSLADAGQPPASCVSPTIEGGAVIQWQWDSGRLEIEINEPYRAECMLSVRGQKPKHWILG